jgi:hypothetical protein
MERPEQVEKAAKSQDNDASVRFLEEVRSGDDPAARAKGANMKKEAQAIADCFDFDKSKGAWTDKMDAGAKRLSGDLQQLAGDVPAYNKFLKEVAKDINAIPSRELPMTPEVKLGEVDPKTGSFKNALIYINADSWDSHEAYRIVQPGNTLSQVVKDCYDDLVKVKQDDGGMDISRADFMKKVMEKNHITNPDKIKVGQVLYMDRY